MSDKKVDPQVMVRMHQGLTRFYLNKIVKDLNYRAKSHDKSINSNKEKIIFEKYINELIDKEKDTQIYDNERPFLGIHFSNNDYYPNHYENGLKEMNLIQLMQLICDIYALISLKDENIETSYVDIFNKLSDRLKTSDDMDIYNEIAKKYNISSDLIQIIKNTVEYLKEI